MTLASLVKTKAYRVLGIDASTNSIAFCLMENNKPLKWGKINLEGEDIYEKIYAGIASKDSRSRKKRENKAFKRNKENCSVA